MKQTSIIATSYSIVIALALLLIMFMSSCSTAKAVYQKGNGWSTAENKSSVTGWSYEKR